MTHHQTYIAGVKFRPGAAEILAGLDEAAAFDLVPEPQNIHDTNAVKIMHGDHHVGYVPRDLSAEVSRALSDNRVDKCCRRAGSKSGTGIEIHFTEGGRHGDPD
ncbi:hypothetical protein LCGC14_1839800 [marine sediment metagenome]|uniref:HIRAN domain-containing protein n=1 Tax=marine sediment metagenome TaxID=412755 RepID=A0A0F9JD05_9ZZZZ